MPVTRSGTELVTFLVGTEFSSFIPTKTSIRGAHAAANVPIRGVHAAADVRVCYPQAREGLAEQDHADLEGQLSKLQQRFDNR